MPASPSTFVPADLDATRFDQVEPLAKALLSRPVRTREELEQWLVDRGELAAACSEAKANLYITMTCDTTDAAASAAFERYIERVEPLLKPIAFELEKRLVELAESIPLDPARYGVLLRGARVEVKLFREQNIPLETHLAQLGQKFEQIAGSMQVEFEGRTQTLPQMARYQEQTDRLLRERAWRCVAERRLKEAGTLHEIYDEMVRLRHQVARNAGFDDYVGYTFQRKYRFDYGPAECFAFHNAVEKCVVPLVRSLERERASKLGVEPLRPWDLAVDVRGRAPLRPFDGGRELMSKTVAAMRSLDPRLAEMLSALGDGSEARGARDGACLDLDSRAGKAPGGYQYMRDRSRRPFIFMNAAGLHSDAVTMVHEAGHAFHSTLAKHEPLLEYRSTTEEFAEVASMGMELLSMRHWAAKGSFYEGRDEDYRRARRDQLKRSIALLPWIATIDAFQHWVYANPGHTRAERERAWLELDARFGSAVSWSGLETVRANLWQRQLHLFSHPFYYIEYGIAMLGALQLWLISLERGEKTAVDMYMHALSLGGSKPLPELFRAAGLEFNFGEAIVSRLVERVRREMDQLPE